MVAVQLGRQLVHQREPALRAVRHRHRDRAVERDDRAALDREQPVVGAGDGQPVGPAVAHVLDGDERLQHVRAFTAERERALHESAALGDRRLVPARAVLVLEQDEPPAASTRASRRESCRRISASSASASGSSGISAHSTRAEPDRLGAQLAADQRVARGRRVALGEHQVQRREHRRAAAGQVLRARELEADAGVAQLALGALEPLRHRVLGHEERPRHLTGGDAAERPQRQRDAGLRRQRRVAAGEDQLEPLVGDRAHRVVATERLEPRAARGRPAPLSRLLAPQPVDRAAPRGQRDPRRRVGRHAVARPALERDDEGVLDRLLGAVEVAERPCQGGDRLPGLAPEQAVDDNPGSAQAYATPWSACAPLRGPSPRSP